MGVRRRREEEAFLHGGGWGGPPTPQLWVLGQHVSDCSLGSCCSRIWPPHLPASTTGAQLEVRTQERPRPLGRPAERQRRRPGTRQEPCPQLQARWDRRRDRRGHPLRAHTRARVCNTGAVRFARHVRDAELALGLPPRPRGRAV